ncbi:tRNA wybutosine-synthesizing protein 4 [Exophiala dermatitidis]
MTSPTPSQGVGPEDEMALEKNAGLIMGTNSSSIVSKRSVERLYLPQPHFYRYFVKKPQRRAPTINRGYWLRMRAIDWVVRQFLEKPSDQKKVIINLGCGYDPIPFQWMAQDKELCENTKFIDIDFEELMLTKREIILNTPKMKELLTLSKESPLEKGVILDSEEYTALGCDLRNLRRLKRLVNAVVDIEDCLVLCIAEVSITYMAPEDSDALIAWTTTLSSEQQSPDRPDNPFTAAMLKHFAKLGTPLRSVLKYPDNHTQTLRFQDAGFPLVEIQSLWELWADPRFLSPSQRMSLDEVEPFDEWEEFALFASHYCLIVAQTGPDPLIPEEPRSRRASVDSFTSDLSTRTVSPYTGQMQWFAYKFSRNPDKEGRTHHASAFSIPGQDAIGVHGGIGPQGRLSTTSVYASAESNMPFPVLPPQEIGARCCHTVTSLDNGQNVLVGGRGSPSAPLKDCWLQTGSKWERIQDLPEPRFRHRAAGVVLPDNQYGVVVFGGKTSATKVALDCLLWDPKNGWQKLRSLLGDPMPRFGASFVRLGFNHGLLFGGMRQDGVICQGLWRWRLIIRDNVVAGIRFKASTALDASAGIFPWLARLGASYSVIRNELLVIGGVAKHGCIPKDYEILSILGSFSAFGVLEKEMELRVACVLPKLQPDVPRPFLVGHATHRTSYETTLLVGGGATCFSFGAYWNPGCWLLYDREAGVSSHWALLKPSPPDNPDPSSPPAFGNSTSKDGHAILHPPVMVERTKVCSEQDFTHIRREGLPKLLTSLDLGPCVSLWAPSYLLSKVPSSKSIVVHSAAGRTMNFQRKDFAYKTLGFHDFITTLTTDPDSHMYLRSISSINPTQLPADFWKDWAELANDFALPPPLKGFIKQTQHSSPLRISSNVNMWLHYDVMANVLFQIRGTRKLVLFPPEDLKYLSFPPGSTTSTIDIFEPYKPVKETATATATTTATDDNNNNNNSHKGDSQSPSQSHPQSQPSAASAAASDHQHKNTYSHGREDEHEPEPTDVLKPIPNTHPHIAILRPGEALYIPPLWAHAATPILPRAAHKAGRDRQQPATCNNTKTDTNTNDNNNNDTNGGKAEPEPDSTTSNPETSSINISLNIFFRSLPPSRYAAGRDVYGNRDLAAYEDGRRDIDRIVRRFLASPAPPPPTTTAAGKGNLNGQSNSDPSGSGPGPGPEPGATTDNGIDVEVDVDIPKAITKAYLERLADELRDRAEKL